MNQKKKYFYAIRNPRRIKAYFKKIRKYMGVNRHSDYRKFILLTRSRTGSNLLLSYLNVHPNIIADHELFQRPVKKPITKVLRKEFRRYPKSINAVGFKIFYNHPLGEDNPYLWKTLKNMEDLYVIHLKRRNILRTMLSLKLALQLDQWIKYNPNQSHNIERKKVSFDMESLEAGFIETRQWEEQGDEMFKDHPNMTIYYEELVESPEETVSKVTDFLGLGPCQPSTYLVRQNPEKASDLIENYKELKEYFSGSPWESFFDE